MNILVLGLSSIFNKRFKISIENTVSVKYIDCASLSKSKSDFNSLKLRDFYSSYETALENSDAEIVYVSTRNNDHSRLIKMALKNDKHVMVDKPSVIHYPDALEIYKIAKEKNLCVSEVIVYQYHPQFNQIKNIFKQNNSNPTHISTVFSIPGFETSNFRYYKKYGGGAILDLGPYAMTLGSVIFESNPISCKGFKFKSANFEVETSFSINLEYPNGCSLVGYFGFETKYMNSMSILGNDLQVKSDRVFTIPADFENKLIISDCNNNKSHYNTKNCDIFFEYLNNVVSKIHNSNWLSLNDQFLNNSKLLSQLKTSLN